MYKFDDLYPIIKDEVSKGHTIAIRIHGTSMKPLLKDNTKVLLSKVDEININDIIFFERENKEYVIHRVVSIDGDNISFIGDHQTIIEKNIKLSQCFAKAIGYYKKDKLKYFKGIGYKLYLFSLKFKFIRRIYTRC